MKISQAKLFREAAKVIPSGVNSPVRAFKSVGGTPVFVDRAKGAYLWDAEGHRYLDFCASWGPMLLGHAPAGLVRDLRRAVARGTSYGAATAAEVTLARAVRSAVPSIEKVRLVSSGTEAVMSAIRLARGFTGRKKIVKFAGGYHGHVDSMLVAAGSGLATFGIPDSAGVPDELARLTITIPFNDTAALERVFKKEGRQIAALIAEPVPANMGVILPEKGYLEKLRSITRKYGSLLIFDEVITGFRLSRGGAQKRFKIKPDLTCLGKILGGGMPLAAFGGSARIMDQLAPAGPVYQAGTLSGNPVAVTAALWMMCETGRSGLYTKLEKKTAAFVAALEREIKKHGYPVTINRIGSMFTLFFTKGPVRNYDDAKKSDTARYAKHFHYCLKKGIYLAPSQFEANFISAAHTQAHLNKALLVFRESLARLF